MISSNGIKTLCKAIIGISYFFGFCLVISFIISIITNKSFGFLNLILGILLPLITTIALYPIFTLANIDDNLQSLRDNIDLLIESQMIDTEYNGESDDCDCNNDMVDNKEEEEEEEEV